MSEYVSGMVRRVSSSLTFHGKPLSIDDCMNEKVTSIRISLEEHLTEMLRGTRFEKLAMPGVTESEADRLMRRAFLDYLD